jgi:hypothetical protein
MTEVARHDGAALVEEVELVEAAALLDEVELSVTVTVETTVMLDAG